MTMCTKAELCTSVGYSASGDSQLKRSLVMVRFLDGDGREEGTVILGSRDVPSLARWKKCSLDTCCWGDSAVKGSPFFTSLALISELPSPAREWAAEASQGWQAMWAVILFSTCFLTKLRPHRWLCNHHQPAHSSPHQSDCSEGQVLSS